MIHHQGQAWPPTGHNLAIIGQIRSISLYSVYCTLWIHVQNTGSVRVSPGHWRPGSGRVSVTDPVASLIHQHALIALIAAVEDLLATVNDKAANEWNWLKHF